MIDNPIDFSWLGRRIVRRQPDDDVRTTRDGRAEVPVQHVVFRTREHRHTIVLAQTREHGIGRSIRNREDDVVHASAPLDALENSTDERCASQIHKRLAGKPRRSHPGLNNQHHSCGHRQRLRVRVIVTPRLSAACHGTAAPTHRRASPHLRVPWRWHGCHARACTSRGVRPRPSDPSPTSFGRS